MNHSDKKDLVSYTTSTGTVLYYNLITTIYADTVDYNGETRSASPELIEALKAGKERYELYKLEHMKSDAELVIDEKIENLVKDYFEEKFDATKELFESEHSAISTSIDKLSTDTASSTTSLSAILDKAQEVSSKLVKAYETADFSTTKDTIESDLQKLSDARAEFDNVVKDLKSLYA